MDSKRHKFARTTPATRRDIQPAPKSTATVARELGVAVTTSYKWKRAGRVHDGSHARPHLQASTAPEQEPLLPAWRLPVWRDAVEAERESSGQGPAGRGAQAPHPWEGVCSHSLRRHALGSENLEPLAPAAQLCLVARARATRAVWVPVLPRRDVAPVAPAVEAVLAAFPHPVHTVLTANEGTCPDRLAGHTKGPPPGPHRLDPLCRVHGIIPRLIRPSHPQTHGRGERVNRRLSDA